MRQYQWLQTLCETNFWAILTPKFPPGKTCGGWEKKFSTRRFGNWNHNFQVSFFWLILGRDLNVNTTRWVTRQDRSRWSYGAPF